MKNIKEESRCLASLAVFRELYDNQKDIYGIISEFINDIIISNGKFQFNLTEITNLLNLTYDFSIPEAVVYTSLKRLNYLKKEVGIYTASSIPNRKGYDVNILQKEIQTSNEAIIENLFSFIETVKKTKLSENEKVNIVHSFCAFLLDESTSEEYSEYISGFTIKNKQNEEFKKKLNKIREGVILYSGLKYNISISEVGSWKTDLTIYLDTEILFHFAGYNGELYKSLFNDFFRYVKEINNKAQKTLIKLRYFKEVGDEIERFFTKAENIVDGKDIPNPKVTAMSSVIDGCKVPSDVMDKKSDFNLLLSNNGIYEGESIDYNEETNYEFNIVDQDTIKAISSEFDLDITEHLRFLNYISIHRKDANLNSFYNIEYILLTGNLKTIQVAWHKLVKSEGVVPLATTLHWITNKFWFKLNKGFGDGGAPISFDVITKAQIILSHTLGVSIGEKYEELKNQFMEGKISEDQAKARLVNLRSQVRKPEEIEQDDIASILDVITEDSIERFVKEQELIKNEASKHAKENIILRKDIIEKDKALREEEIARITAQNERNRISTEAKEKLLEEKKGKIIILETQKKVIDEMVNKRFNNLKTTIGCLLIVNFIIFSYLIIQYWNILEKWAFILSLMPTLITCIYMLIYGKSPNPMVFLEKKRYQYQQQIFAQMNFDNNQLINLKRDVSQLEVESENRN